MARHLGHIWAAEQLFPPLARMLTVDVSCAALTLAEAITGHGMIGSCLSGGPATEGSTQAETVLASAMTPRG